MLSTTGSAGPLFIGHYRCRGRWRKTTFLIHLKFILFCLIFQAISIAAVWRRPVHVYNRVWTSQTRGWYYEHRLASSGQRAPSLTTQFISSPLAAGVVCRVQILTRFDIPYRIKFTTKLYIPEQDMSQKNILRKVARLRHQQKRNTYKIKWFMCGEWVSNSRHCPGK